MDFTKTQTFYNLARGFAGECQAGMRYQLTAKAATAEGYQVLSDTIRSIAKNETVHATIFFNEIIKNAGSQENVHIDANYPFHAGSLAENLKFAALDELSEAENIYPEFARIARDEGFEQIARKFEQVAMVEGNHRIIFEYLHEAFKDGSLYRAERPMLWICGDCGYMHTSKEAFTVCPLCGAKQGKVELHLPFKKENI
ncbi:MAG: rubrerythrin family protein [Clostridia bacterium]|jgi:rubrerythrin|nr:rubrerythrin family protein [Clostridia bacterium]